MITRKGTLRGWNGSKFEAIKVLRSATGLGLKEAKAIIEKCSWAPIELNFEMWSMEEDKELLEVFLLIDWAYEPNLRQSFKLSREEASALLEALHTMEEDSERSDLIARLTEFVNA